MDNTVGTTLFWLNINYFLVIKEDLESFRWEPLSVALRSTIQRHIYICICVCVFLHIIYIYTYTCIHIHIYIYIYTYLCLYEYEYGCEYVFVGLVTCGRNQRDNSCRHAASILPISRFGRVFVATWSVRENHPSSLPASVAGIGESDAWKRTQTLPAVGPCEFDSKVDSKKPAA